MLCILSQYTGPRLRYTAKLIFGEILDIPWRIISNIGDAREHERVISYGMCSPHAVIFQIPACGLLNEDNGLTRFPYPDKDGIHGDLFAGVFWWATGYAYQSEPCYDTHGRYDFASYTHIQNGLHLGPQVHTYTRLIAALLRPYFANLPVHTRTYKPAITVDVDQPWLFRHKPLHIVIASILKHALSFDFIRLKAQIWALLSGQDPNDTFDELCDLAGPDHTRFFFLLERKHVYDTRHTWRNPAFNSLIKKIAHKGYGLGIHPSYTTFLDQESIIDEVNQLTNITGKETRHSRMHFLRYRQPETFRALIQAGITHDYSTGLYHDLGFAYGMAIPFPWFDLEKNEETSLMLHPTIAMDRTMLSYLKLKPNEAVGRFRSLVDQVKAVRGECVLLLHNDSLSDFGEWKGWKDAVIEMIRVLNAK